MSGRLEDWIEYTQDTQINLEGPHSLHARPPTNASTLPATSNWDGGNGVQTVSLTHLAKGRSNPAHGGKEQADGHHLEHAEMKTSRDEEPTNKQWNPERTEPL